MTVQEKIDRFAKKFHEDTVKDFERRGLNNIKNDPNSTGVTVKTGQKYAKVDIGRSGRFMVEMETGIIYGIKAYGQIHKGHSYGTLDTIDDWNYGPYYPVRIKSAGTEDEGTHPEAVEDGEAITGSIKK